MLLLLMLLCVGQVSFRRLWAPPLHSLTVTLYDWVMPYLEEPEG
jgi:hypothetical protein